MKISTNTQLAEFKANWIDFNAGTLVEDESRRPCWSVISRVP